MVNLNEWVGEYCLLREIGRGSCGVVYLAEDKTRRKVALKLLQPDLLNPWHMNIETVRQSFLEEVRILKKIKHPHILSILNDGFHNGWPYLVTEHASGGSLADRMQPQQPFPLEEAINIISQIGRALYHAHEQHNVVHRDLKPANILFNVSGDVLLADFGIAVVLESNKTQTANFAGTPSYMPPEQFQSKVSKKIDQFALGCVAYHLVTGYYPFKSPQWWITNEKPMRPTLLNPLLPVYMEQAILKALEKQRTDRHRDIFTFISALCPSKDQWLHEGDSYYKAQRYEEALHAYGQAIQLDRYYADAFISRGKALYALGRNKEALAAYKQAIKLDPDNANAYYRKGITLRRLKRYEEALSAFEQAILHDPKNVDV